MLLLAHRAIFGNTHFPALCRASVRLHDVLLGPRPFLPYLVASAKYRLITCGSLKISREGTGSLASCSRPRIDSKGAVLFFQ